MDASLGDFHQLEEVWPLASQLLNLVEAEGIDAGYDWPDSRAASYVVPPSFDGSLSVEVVSKSSQRTTSGCRSASTLARPTGHVRS